MVIADSVFQVFIYIAAGAFAIYILGAFVGFLSMALPGTRTRYRRLRRMMRIVRMPPGLYDIDGYRYFTMEVPGEWGRWKRRCYQDQGDRIYIVGPCNPERERPFGCVTRPPHTDIDENGRGVTTYGDVTFCDRMGMPLRKKPRRLGRYYGNPRIYFPENGPRSYDDPWPPGEQVRWPWHDESDPYDLTRHDFRTGGYRW